MKRKLSLLFGAASSAPVAAAEEEKKYLNNLKDPEFRARAEKHAQLLSEFHIAESRRFSACVLPPAAAGSPPLAVDVQVAGDQKISLGRDGGALLLESSRPFVCSLQASVIQVRPASGGTAHKLWRVECAEHCLTHLTCSSGTLHAVQPLALNDVLAVNASGEANVYITGKFQSLDARSSGSSWTHCVNCTADAIDGSSTDSSYIGGFHVTTRASFTAGESSKIVGTASSACQITRNPPEKVVIQTIVGDIAVPKKKKKRFSLF